MTTDVLGTALQHLRSGRFADAEEQLGAILERTPTDPDAWHLLGVAALHAGRAGEAADCIVQAISFAAERFAYRIDLALALCALRRFDAAEASLRLTIALAPDAAPAHANLGAVLLGL
ncbi:MAG TPA: tetratricopeptide repeat protein, partial [Azospirillum sp.]